MFYFMGSASYYVSWPIILPSRHGSGSGPWNPGSGTMSKGAAGPQAPDQQLIGPWDLVPGPRPHRLEPDPCRLGNMVGPDAWYDPETMGYNISKFPRFI